MVAHAFKQIQKIETQEQNRYYTLITEQRKTELELHCLLGQRMPKVSL